MQQLVQLLAPIQAFGLGPDGTQPDTGMWYNEDDVPVASLWNQAQDYFIYHHTHGDLAQ